MSGSADAMLIRVANGPAQVLVTIYQATVGRGHRAAPAGAAPVRRSGSGPAGARPECRGCRARRAGRRRAAGEDAGGRCPCADARRYRRPRSATGSARKAASAGSRASSWRPSRRSRRPISNTRRCSAAAGCRPGSKAASSAAAVAWHCRSSACGCACAARRPATYDVSYSATFVDGTEIGPVTPASRARQRPWRRWRHSSWYFRQLAQPARRGAGRRMIGAATDHERHRRNPRRAASGARRRRRQAHPLTAVVGRGG